jgi:hypothetical protein
MLQNDKNLENHPEIKIEHTGSGGAFDGTEHPDREPDRDMSDEQLDERLENKPGQDKERRPAY